MFAIDEIKKILSVATIDRNQLIEQFVEIKRRNRHFVILKWILHPYRT